MSELLTYVIIGLMIYLCIYAIVERICKCKEQCAMFKAAGDYFSSMGKVTVSAEDFGKNMGAIMQAIRNHTEDNKNAGV